MVKVRRVIIWGLVLGILSSADGSQAGMLRDLMLARQAKKLVHSDGDTASPRSAPASTSAGYIQLQSKGLAREYILHTPPGESTSPMPLVIVIHGTVGTGKKMEDSLGFNPYADRYGFAVAYPDAYVSDNGKNTTRWNDGRDTLESSKLGVDDVGFIRDMVADIGQRIPLDRSRVFVTGPSNGGIMTYRLICEASDLFAAAAPVIGNIAVSTSQTCSPRHPMSILAINGTEDPFVPFAGGTVCKNIPKALCEKGEVISAERSLAMLAKSFGCSDGPRHAMLAPTVAADPQLESVVYDRCAANTRVSAYWIHGGGHTWPPNSGQLGSKNGRPTKNLDATEAIVNFFMAVRP